MPENPVHTRESLLYEAQAQILWGYPQEKVHDWLLAKGIDPAQAQEIIRACLVDRTAQIRRRASFEILLGSAVCLMSGVVVAGMFLAKEVIGKLLIIAVMAELYGLYRLFRGIGLLISGARYRGSVTEIGEGWFAGWFGD
jgi:hypothetical protein